MRPTVRRLAALALALLLWRLVIGRRGGGLVMAGERPDCRYAIRGLRVNVFRPESEGRYPVIMCAHPYGKDRLPKRGPLGYRPQPQYRGTRHSVTFSAWTSWEAPDPAYWVPRGNLVVNCDLRGFGTSEGRGNLLTDAEARDVYDLIEWAGTQPWSNGKVGMNGVSYLAISQYKVAALRPPHLSAICPWEGLSDVYRYFARPGGIRDDGFIRLWSAGVKRGGRPSEDIREEQIARPLRDEWWAARTPELQRIEVPMLVCGSFSDQELHTRGSFCAFERVGSPHRWLYTHRGAKLATYYCEEALTFQRRFLDHFLKGEENGMLEVPPCAWRSARTATRSKRCETRRRGRCRKRAGRTFTCTRTGVSSTRRWPIPRW